MGMVRMAFVFLDYCKSSGMRQKISRTAYRTKQAWAVQEGQRIHSRSCRMPRNAIERYNLAAAIVVPHLGALK